MLVEEAPFRDRVVVDMRVTEPLPLDDRDLTGEPEQFPDRHAEQQEQERGVEQQAAALAQVSLLPGDRSIRAHQAEPLAPQHSLCATQRDVRRERDGSGAVLGL